MSRRVFDVVGAVLALLLLAPGLVWVALAIKLDSRGPVFFRQERVGRAGVPFRIHKFRTMTVEGEPDGRVGPVLSLPDDRRVTPVGAWLRARRIDELAQFIDVIKGDMSLVGPRPEVPRYVARLPEDLRTAVLRVRPGMTDVSSLAFRDEAVRLAQAADPERLYVDELLPAKARLAVAYQASRRGVLSDAGVLVRSLGVLLGRAP